MRRAFAAVAALLALAACATARDRTARAPDGAYVAFEVAGLDAQGEHRSGNRTLYFSDRLDAEEVLARHVAAHELGHALGADHVPAPAIMASSHGPGETPIEALTPREVRGASGAKGVRSVRADASVSPRLYRALAWGCALWNSALGREVLRLEPR